MIYVTPKNIKAHVDQEGTALGVNTGSEVVNAIDTSAHVSLSGNAPT